jgi:translin
MLRETTKRAAQAESMADISKTLDSIMEGVREHFVSKNDAREKALPLCREAIRLSANAIRAVHRDDFTTAQELVERAGSQLQVAQESLAPHPDVRYAGFVHDAQKEYAEASITLALISGRDLPGPEALSVELPAYLNGMGEAVGELRRHLLDTLRTGDVDRCEEWLRAMDDIYSVLVTIDYPDAMTGGLRRTTDSVRGILEKTRGDLTLSVQQRRLEQRLDSFGEKLG